MLQDGNTKIRDLLLKNAVLIPPSLLEDAGRLIEHYDRWLEEFSAVFPPGQTKLNAPFVFVGPQGYPFPSDAEKRFCEAFKAYWNELYK